MSYTKLYYHIVFTPKQRRRVIHKDVRRDVYKIIYKQLVKQSCYVHRIGGMDDHVHILADIPARLAVSDVIKIVKQESSKEIKNSFLIQEWESWEEGYSAFSCGYRELNGIKNYIANQETHHRTISFKDEYRQWLIDNGIDESDPFFPK